METSVTSTREAQLEALLKEKDVRVAELTDEVSRLRQGTSSQTPRSSPAELVSLPPALLALLQPHVSGASSSVARRSSVPSVSDWSLLAAGLAQKTRLLQEENNELYDKLGEGGILKQEVRSLRKIVSKLERALTEAHGVIGSLSTDLNVALDALLVRRDLGSESRASMYSPRSTSSHPTTKSTTGTTNTNLKPIPTGPRAQKKPRLSEPKQSPAQSTVVLPTTQLAPSSKPPHAVPNAAPRPNSNRRREVAESSSIQARPKVTSPSPSQIDSGRSPNGRSPHRKRTNFVAGDRSRDHEQDGNRTRDGMREREHDKQAGPDRERRREKERQRGDRGSRTNQPSSGVVAGGRRDVRNNVQQGNGDRSLAERMGL